ncbi:MAG: hypothetical protein RLZZ314_518, partial [Bacteroidota bacterium]
MAVRVGLVLASWLAVLALLIGLASGAQAQTDRDIDQTSVTSPHVALL